MSEPIVTRLSDVDPVDSRSRAAIESAYRRGFCQGVWAAIEGVENGKTDKQLKAWYFRLYRWRLAKHKGRFTEPEWIARGK